MNYYCNVLEVRRAWKLVNEANRIIEEAYRDERAHWHGKKNGGGLKELKALLKTVSKTNKAIDRFAFTDN